MHNQHPDALQYQVPMPSVDLRFLSADQQKRQLMERSVVEVVVAPEKAIILSVRISANLCASWWKGEVMGKRR